MRVRITSTSKPACVCASQHAHTHTHTLTLTHPHLHTQQQAAQTARSSSSWLADLKQLSKFRLSALVALTGSAGFVAGSGEHIDWAKLAWTSLGTMGAACSANALNQLYEIRNDARMRRTLNRPLPAGRISPVMAAAWAVVSGAGGLGLLYWQV